MSLRPTHSSRTAAGAEREAAVWFARLQADDVSETDRTRFQRWLDASPSHRLAYGSFERLWSNIGTMAGEPEMAAAVEHYVHDAAPAEPALRVRRLRWPYALAASLIAALGLAYFAQHGNRYETGIGEQRTLVLDDGSKITLDTDTQLSVDYGDDARRIRLERGQAYFRVAHDAQRPFDVMTRDGSVRALGTEFDLRLRDGNALVTLVHGLLAVAAGNAELPSREADAARQSNRAAVIRTGQQAVLAHGGISVLQAASLQTSTAWLSGNLMFSDEPLASAVAEMNRYSIVRIIIGDSSLQSLRIGGVFRSGESQAFVDAVSAYFPVRVERDAAGNYVLSKAAVGG